MFPLASKLLMKSSIVLLLSTVVVPPLTVSAARPEEGTLQRRWHRPRITTHGWSKLNYWIGISAVPTSERLTSTRLVGGYRLIVH